MQGLGVGYEKRRQRLITGIVEYGRSLTAGIVEYGRGIRLNAMLGGAKALQRHAFSMGARCQCSRLDGHLPVVISYGIDA